MRYTSNGNLYGARSGRVETGLEALLERLEEVKSGDKDKSKLVFARVRNKALKNCAAAPVLRELMCLEGECIIRANVLNKNNVFMNFHGVRAVVALNMVDHISRNIGTDELSSQIRAEALHFIKAVASGTAKFQSEKVVGALEAAYNNVLYVEGRIRLLLMASYAVMRLEYLSGQSRLEFARNWQRKRARTNTNGGRGGGFASFAGRSFNVIGAHQRSNKPCLDYNKTGKCYYGRNCRFNHSCNTCGANRHYSVDCKENGN